MHQAFFKSKPTRDTPYRQLSLTTDDAGNWRVQLTGGTNWGAEHKQVFSTFSVADFDDGVPVYDRLYLEITREGWRPYIPQQTWE